MKALRQLVAGVAHEINNPIGVISSSNDSIYRSVPRIRTILNQELQEKGRENKELIKMLSLLESTSQASNTASIRVGRIVTSLRNFVGLDEAEWRMADINEGIDTTLSLMELGSLGRIKITKDYGHIPRIYCCPSSLNQVFMSMLRNSTEAIEGEGEIRVKTSVEGEYIKIVISDSGRGILPENLDRIFDPGFTTKSVGVGVGLGLATCYKIIVDEHRGHINVSSDLGLGTAFSITLPLSRWEGNAKK
jgi:signal transduction histidine kinase